MTHRPNPITTDNLVDFDHSFRTGGDMTHEATTAPTSEVEYHGILTDPTFRRYTAAERLGAKLGELTVYALLVVGAWTLLKWLATAIVAMDAHEDCVRLSRQADYGYIDQAAVPQYCDALLSP